MVAVNWEGRIQTPVSRTVKWLSLRLSPRQLEGNRVQWEGIMMNITRSKQAEIEINQSRQRLSELSAHLQSAKEQERTKIAREVHDDIGGNLTAIKIDLLWLINRLGNAAPQMLEKARAIEALTDRTMEITSRIAGDLRPPLLELGLLAAIEWEAGEFEKRMEIPCVVNCAGKDVAVEPELANALFSIFRETLTNISKHARATAVRVDFGVGDGRVLLSVTDNGRGIHKTDPFKAGSFGLRGMLERARNLGGEVSFKKASGGGTTISVRLPLDSPQQAAVPLKQNATDTP
jgi:signal transduction histidine kinase